MNPFRTLLFTLAAALLPTLPAAAIDGPGAYTFTENVPADWTAGLPADIVEVTATCQYSKAERAVYILTDLCGLSEGIETEFIVAGPLSDRAYEAFAIARDLPSVIARAVEALGVPPGQAADPLAGRGMAKGERFTLSVRRLGPEGDTDFRPLSDFVEDTCSTPAQNLFGRGFPYVGNTPELDTHMPSAVVASYTEPISLFGLPFHAPKSQVYGLFRAKSAETGGRPAVIRLAWDRLRDGQPRVYDVRLPVTKADLDSPDAILEKLKALCEDPRDVFLTPVIADDVPLEKLPAFAALVMELDRQGGITVDTAESGQISLRAFLPNPVWNERSNRVFQPWEIEVAPGEAPGKPRVTLCRIIEDWTAEGNEPALTRSCYPGLNAKTLDSAMQRLDTEDGRIYVAFFYAAPGLTMGDIGPLSTAILKRCPTQWVFLQPAPAMGAAKAEKPLGTPAEESDAAM